MPMSPFAAARAGRHRCRRPRGRRDAPGLPRPLRALADTRRARGVRTPHRLRRRRCARRSTPKSPRWCRPRADAPQRRRGSRPRAARTGRGDRPDARRRCRQRGSRHRPLHGAGRRLAVLARRHHAVPGPHPASPTPCAATGSTMGFPTLLADPDHLLVCTELDPRQLRRRRLLAARHDVSVSEWHEQPTVGPGMACGPRAGCRPSIVSTSRSSGGPTARAVRPGLIGDDRRNAVLRSAPGAARPRGTRRDRDVDRRTRRHVDHRRRAAGRQATGGDQGVAVADLTDAHHQPEAADLLLQLRGPTGSVVWSRNPPRARDQAIGSAPTTCMRAGHAEHLRPPVP